MKKLKNTISISLLTSCVGCVAPIYLPTTDTATFSLPTRDIATLEKTGIDDPQKSHAGYRHWTSDIIEVTNLDTKKVIYKPSEWEIRDPLVAMYLELPPSNYLVKTRCTHSLDISKANVWLDELNIEVKGSEKMQLKVSFGENTCTTRINKTTLISK